MMKVDFLLLLTTLLAAVPPGSPQETLPDAESDCCEGDILLVLDSSGSISAYEFSRLLQFLADLLQNFSLGPGQVRVGLLLVGTAPHLQFGLDAHHTQASLQSALLHTRQLQGDTNTEAALRLALDLLTGSETEPRPAGDAALPKVLVWLTDGEQPGDVDEAMSELKQRGVAVLAVSTGHRNYPVLRRSVTPPVVNHLYFVDIDDVGIITEDLRDAIIELIHAERLRVARLSPHGAALQWRPVLTTETGYYELRYRCVTRAEGGASSDTSPGCTNGQHHSHTLPGDSSWAELTNLQPDTTYTASLTPESNQEILNTLSITFTTPPEILSPAVVLVSDSAPHQLRVSWGPLQPARVRGYRVEYGAIPTGRVHTVSLPGHQNSTLLTGLEPDTQYLVTVSGLHAAGQERAMSVKACTQEAVLPALTDLRLTPVDQEGTQVMWRGQEEGLRGYWISWQGENAHNPSEPLTSAVYLPPGSLSTQLTHLAPHSRVCVSPVYTTGRGEAICCQAD